MYCHDYAGCKCFSCAFSLASASHVLALWQVMVIGVPFRAAPFCCEIRHQFVYTGSCDIRHPMGGVKATLFICRKLWNPSPYGRGDVKIGHHRVCVTQEVVKYVTLWEGWRQNCSTKTWYVALCRVNCNKLKPSHSYLAVFEWLIYPTFLFLIFSTGVGKIMNQNVIYFLI